MWFALRHLVAVAIVPGIVTIGVPVWIVDRYAVPVAMPHSLAGFVAVVLGGVTGIAGLVLFASSLLRFGREGRGTLAPWDPPRELVIGGPYRYVRNPMISGVILILAAEALVLRSAPHGWWTAIFVGINATYIPLLEEPLLALRFGSAYDEYRRHVPRLLPRLRPWAGPGESRRAGAP